MIRKINLLKTVILGLIFLCCPGIANNNLNMKTYYVNRKIYTNKKPTRIYRISSRVKSIRQHLRSTISVGGKIHQQGVASWYGPKFNHRLTASGVRYNMYGLSAASRTIPLNTMVKVTNLRNGKAVMVKVNDRGPYVRGRILDLSYGAAQKLGIVGRGTALVDIQSV